MFARSAEAAIEGARLHDVWLDDHAPRGLIGILTGANQATATPPST
jgi:hypothetical protein